MLRFVLVFLLLGDERRTLNNSLCVCTISSVFVFGVPLAFQNRPVYTPDAHVQRDQLLLCWRTSRQTKTSQNTSLAVPFKKVPRSNLMGDTFRLHKRLLAESRTLTEDRCEEQVC